MEKNISVPSHLYKNATENEKIMWLIGVYFNSKSEDDLISLKRVINKGIELGLCDDWPRNQHDGHPWYPRVATMMGVGGETAVHNNEEPSLHRAKRNFVDMDGENTNAYVYWVDTTKRHEIVRRGSVVVEGSGKTAIEHTIRRFEVNNLSPLTVEQHRTYTVEQKFEVYEKAYPGRYILFGGKILSLEMLRSRPEHFKNMYGSKIEQYL